MASLGLNATGFETGLKRAESQVHHFGSEISSEIKGKLAAAFGGAAIEEAFRRTIEYAHKLKDLNLRTGLSTDELQTWDFAAQRAGTTIESMVGAMEKLGVAQAKALGPNGAETFQMLQRLGLSGDQIRNLDDLGTNLKVVFETIRSAPAGGQVLKDMREALGRSATELMPLIREGLDEASERLDHLNGRLRPDQIDRMAESAIRFKEIWFSIRPVIGDVSSAFSEFTQASLRGWAAIGAGAKSLWRDLSSGGKTEQNPFGKAIGAMKESVAGDVLSDQRKEAARYGFGVDIGALGEDLATKPGSPPPPAFASLTDKEQSHGDQIHKQLVEETLRLELQQATAVERRFILQRRIAEFEDIAAKAKERMKYAADVDPRDQIAYEEAKLASMKLQGQLENVHDEKTKSGRQVFDSLARTGGLGAASDLGTSAQNLQRAMHQTLRQIEEHTRRFIEYGS
jgi:hypothetical protein